MPNNVNIRLSTSNYQVIANSASSLTSVDLSVSGGDIVCASHGVSPRDRWVCVLAKIRNVNGGGT
jgi:hypothetical protein